MYGQSYHVKDEITIGDLAARTTHVVSREMDVVRSQLARNRVSILTGTGSFVDPHTVEVDGGEGRVRRATADKIVIATGTRPARPASVEFDERTVIDSDGIVNLDSVPRSMLVAGAGVIGIEYASMFAALGTKVTVVEQRERMLEFCDVEVVEALKYHLRDLAVTFRFGETVSSVEARPEGAIATLLSGKKIPADTVMYSAGRQGASDDLNLDAAGLTADKRGRIAVVESYQTSVPHIYAVGDVIGFPALAATSMEQGRVAAHHACGEPLHALGQIHRPADPGHDLHGRPRSDRHGLHRDLHRRRARLPAGHHLHHRSGPRHRADAHPAAGAARLRGQPGRPAPVRPAGRPRQRQRRRRDATTPAPTPAWWIPPPASRSVFSTNTVTNAANRDYAVPTYMALASTPPRAGQRRLRGYPQRRPHPAGLRAHA